MWREDLSERVEEFRRRRAGLGKLDPKTSLEFDFNAAPGEEGTATDDQVDDRIEFPNNEQEEEQIAGASGFQIANVSLQKDEPAESAVPEEFETAVEEPDAWSLGPLPRRASEPRPLETVLEDENWNTSTVSQAEAPVLGSAPLGKRFHAAVIDALVLLLGFGVFGAIVYLAGGHFSLSRSNEVVMASIAILLVLVYFGAFTALASSTPGLLWKGLEIRRLDGTRPGIADSVIRSFGYLISTGALMLGFIWALVDSGGLTWHDRMSGTVVVELSPESGGDD